MTETLLFTCCFNVFIMNENLEKIKYKDIQDIKDFLNKYMKLVKIIV